LTDKSATPPPSVKTALAEATAVLRRAGSPTPRLDAEVLLAHVVDRDRAWLFAHPEAPIGEIDAWTDALARRAAGEPIAYIRGFKEWGSLRIRTDRRALIPRPETELLAEAAMAEIDERLLRDPRPVTVREVATGSGALTVALALRFRDALADGRLELVASDLSREALDLAAENLAAHGVAHGVRLVEADLLELAEAASARPDVVIANLPYVPTADVDAGTGSLAHEPRMALDGGPDGLDVVRRFLDEAPGRVAHDAVLLLEIGAGQAQAVRALAPPGASVSLIPDLAGIERVVRIDGVTLSR
jgi:release factor glutamine methyltransferase